MLLFRRHLKCTIQRPYASFKTFNRSRVSIAAVEGNDPVTKASPPPAPQPTWTDPSFGSNLCIQKKIFCNRSLPMDSIKAIGFDMDYTLAQYKPEAFERLAHEETIKKLINDLEYPKEIQDFEFDWHYMMRGLVIDKQRGNVLKIDRHKYVKLAYHGFKSLTRDERHKQYGRSELRDSFDEPDYTTIDTLFSISEAYMYMKLVELKDSNKQKSVLSNKSYFEMYNDVRQAVDLSHRDGSIKRKVAEEPERYIFEDELLLKLLEMLRKSEKKIFLATNSLWEYTNVAMNYLLGKKKGKERDLQWLDYFDVVITGCGKPRYFNSRNALFVVNPEDGTLANTDKGAPTTPLYDDDESGAKRHKFPKESKVYQGGVYLDLHQMLDIQSGTEVLYIGDHIYGDILRSKKTLGWRTMLVMPELARELSKFIECQESQNKLLEIRRERNNLEDRLEKLKWFLESNDAESISCNGYLTKRELEEEITKLTKEKEDLSKEHTTGLKKYHEQFHPIWGRLLKTGYQNSILAHQIDRFACLYTSHVSNLVFSSPYKRYRGRVDHMAHEVENNMK